MKKWADYLFVIGRPFSPFYSLVMCFRAFLYRRNILKRHQLSVPVVSVGNLTMGGTGKTPMVLHLAKLLDKHGFKPAVVSRGYGGKSREVVDIVSDGETIFLPAKISGDEPRFLAENLAGIPVLIGRKRVEVGRKAIADYGVKTIILDDGFQHLAVERRLDLVLFSGHELIGNGFVFPGGVLRESFAALKRAHAFVITGICEGEDPRADDLVSDLGKRFPGRPVFYAPYQMENIYQIKHKKKYTTGAELPGPLLAFCGLANPKSFRTTLEQNKIIITDFKVFRDHHEYSQEDLQLLFDEACLKGACGLITTEKDGVKLEPIMPAGLNIFILKASLAIREDLDGFVLKKVQTALAMKNI